MTREEAIRRVKAWNLDSDDMEVLAAVIPELRESEDEKLRKEIISALKFANDGGVYDKHIAYLEMQKPSFRQIHDSIMWDRGLNAGIELEKQKEQKPAEWAKLTLLGENIINAAVAFVEQNDHFNCWGGIDKHTVIKALRSLKPHWKPTGEQIRTLDNVISDYRHACTEGSDKKAEILKLLLEQLEKL